MPTATVVRVLHVKLTVVRAAGGHGGVRAAQARRPLGTGALLGPAQGCGDERGRLAPRPPPGDPTSPTGMGPDPPRPSAPSSSAGTTTSWQVRALHLVGPSAPSSTGMTGMTTSSTGTTTSARSPARVAADFAMGGAAAVLAKTGAAPVERVKLLLQNQAETLRRGALTRPYRGITDAFARVLREEGAAALWCGNQANVIRYFPTQ